MSDAPVNEPSSEKLAIRRVCIRAEQSTESTVSTSTASGARSTTSSSRHDASGRIFNVAIAGLAKAQAAEGRETAGQRKKSARHDMGNEGKLRRLVEEWWRILGSMEEGVVKLSQFIRLWEVFGGKPLNTEQRNVLLRVFRCKNNLDREITFKQFEAFCAHQLKVQREMRKQGQASSLSSDDYIILALMPIQTIFLAAKRSMVMHSFFSGNFDSEDLNWQMPDYLQRQNPSSHGRGVKHTRMSMAASSWRAAALMALEKERSSELHARRGRGNALRIGLAPNASAQSSLAEEEWPELPRLLAQLQEMPYASPMSSVSLTGDEKYAGGSVSRSTQEWRPRSRGFRPFSCSAVRAEVRTDDFFTRFAPAFDRAEARAEITSPLRHSKDVAASRARSAVPSFQRDGNYSQPAASLAEICRPALNSGSTAHRRSSASTASSRSLLTTSHRLRNSRAQTASVRRRPATVPVRSSQDMASHNVKHADAAMSRISGASSTARISSSSSCDAYPDERSSSRIRHASRLRRPVTSPEPLHRAPVETAVPLLHSYPESSPRASRKLVDDESSPRQVSKPGGVTRPGTAPVRSREAAATKHTDGGEMAAAWGWMGGDGGARELRNIGPIPESPSVSENGCDVRSSGWMNPDKDRGDKEGVPAWMEWAKLHKAWAFAVTTEIDCKDDEKQPENPEDLHNSDSDSITVYTDDEDSWDGDSCPSPPTNTRSSACAGPVPRILSPPFMGIHGNTAANTTALREGVEGRPMTAGDASRPVAWVSSSGANERFSYKALQESLRDRVYAHLGRNICSGRHSGHKIATRDNWSLSRRRNDIKGRQHEVSARVEDS